MTNNDDSATDLRSHLVRARPSAPFDQPGLRRRIAATVAGGRPRSRYPRWRVPASVAAAAALFWAGVQVGAMGSTASGPNVAVPGSGTAAINDRVSWLVQSAGSDYVASVARLQAARAYLDEATYQEGRDVAVSALIGAAIELGLGEDHDVARRVLSGLLQQGIALESQTIPVRMYR